MPHPTDFQEVARSAAEAAEALRLFVLAIEAATEHEEVMPAPSSGFPE